MELFQTDLQFLRDKEVVYLSQGDDFDVQSYYSEYEEMKELGAGGFGKVVLAKNKVTQQLVAIKTTYAESVDSAKDLDMLFNEAQTLKALKHPGIVTVLACFVDRRHKQAVLVMEYLGGGELLELVQERERLLEAEARAVFEQLVSAVDHCHARKIIHRDLKLENILRVSRESNAFKVEAFVMRLSTSGLPGCAQGSKATSPTPAR